MPTPSRLDPSDIHGGNWEVFEVTPEYRRSRLWIDEKSYIVRTEYLGEETLIAANQESFNDSQTKRFGDGKVVGRVPLNMLSKWMGHATLEVTAIYANALGAEEQGIAARMW